MCLEMCLHYRFWTKVEFSRKAKVLSTLLQTMSPTKNENAIFKHNLNNECFILIQYFTS